LIQDFYNKLLKPYKTTDRKGKTITKPGLSPKSVRNLHGVLHSAFQQAVMCQFMKNDMKGVRPAIWVDVDKLFEKRWSSDREDVDPETSSDGSEDEETIKIPERTVIPETYSTKIVAYLVYGFTSDEENSFSDPIYLDKSGEYTIEVQFDSRQNEMDTLLIALGCNGRYSDDIYGRCVRVDEVWINGKSVPIEKCNFSLFEEYEGAIILTAPVYSADDALEGEVYTWTGDNSLAEMQIIDPSEFDYIESIKVAFTYGQFE